MSNKVLFLKPKFLSAPLQNGLGRYICQLQRITLKFCKSHGASRGLRDFIEKDMLDYARQYPETAVYLKPRRHRTPCIAAEYLNGDKEIVSCHNVSREEIIKWLNLLRTKSGNSKDERIRKLWHTDSPSVQGPWTPFTVRHPKMNLAQFPEEQLSEQLHLPKTATEQLLEMFLQQSANGVGKEKSKNDLEKEEEKEK